MKLRTVTGYSIAACLLWLQCGGTDNITGNTSEVGNATIAGVLYQSDGKTPAKGVKVVIRPKNSLADTIGLSLGKRLADTATVTTNDSGQFVFDTTLDTGTYVIEAASGNDAVLIDSVTVQDPDSTIDLPPDTLKPAGAIKGIIRLSEGGDPRKVFILAFGIDRFARVNADGSFKFNGLAEAAYDLRLISSLANYGVLDTVRIPVISADTTDLDTLELPFTGIPTPNALSATYDTLANKVSLLWSTENPNLVSGYKVYRREGTMGQYALANDSLLLTTLFIDNLVNGLEKGKTYQYMVRAVDTNENEGLNSDPVTVRIAFFVDAGKDSTYQLGDSVTLSARVDTSTIAATEYRFDANGDGINDLVSATATTFKYAYADTGTYKAVITIQASGKSFSDTVKIIIVPKDTAGAPVAPQELSLSYDTLKQIVTLTWIRNLESDIKGYNVYRKHSDSAFVKINTALISGTTFSDSTAKQDQTYEYRVAAVDKNATEGTKSAGVSVKVVGAFVAVDTLFTAGGNINAITVDRNGNYLVVRYITQNSSPAKVEKYGRQGNLITSWDIPNGIEYSYTFNNIAADDSNSIFVINSANNLIKFDSVGTILKQVQLPGAVRGFSIYKDTVYFGNTTLNKVFAYSSKGDSLFSWGGKGFTDSHFENISSIICDSMGQIYVEDALNFGRIQVFKRDGTFIRSFDFQDHAITNGGTDLIAAQLDVRGTSMLVTGSNVYGYDINGKMQFASFATDSPKRAFFNAVGNIQVALWTGEVVLLGRK